MKRYRSLIAAGAVLLLAGVAVLVLSLNPAPPEQDKDTEPDYKSQVLDLSADDIDHITVTADNGEAFTLFTEQADDETVYRVAGAPEEHTFKDTLFSSLFAQAAQFNTLKLIDDAPQELSVYGLAAPLTRVELFMKDGSRHIIEIGHQSPVGDGYFAKLSGAGSVYLISEATAEIFSAQLISYRTGEIFPVYTTPDEEIVLLAIRRGGKIPELEFRRLAEGDERPLWLPESTYETVTPSAFPSTSHEALKGKILTPLNAVGSCAVVEDHPKDLEKYGLSDPRVIIIEDVLPSVHRLLVGKEDGEGNTYVMKEGLDTVFSVSTSKLSFMDTDYFSILPKVFWSADISKITRLELSSDAGVHVLELETGGDSTLTRALLDGSDISETNAKTLVSRLGNINVPGLLPENASPQAAAAYTLKVTFSAGETATFQFCLFNERQCSVLHDGMDTGLYVLKKDIDSALSAISDIKAGKSIG